ncbi:MAG: KpsF/GutQ family sugar-phosphate isomerase [Alphaproteobacteria bacterium]|nr:KpsF/GutQ family sugar-phosphate isomerase [Alphaproteobacteria bacterium]
MSKFADADILDAGRTVLAEAAQCLAAAGAGLGSAFLGAAQVLAAAGGFTLVMGVGKSGHIGRKVAASLVSTGFAATFVHPGEAAHGDLGLADHATLALLLSDSGASDELVAVAPMLKGFGVRSILVTRTADCPLAAHADWVIETKVTAEAGIHRLAPTSSTTTTLALCDALMMASLAIRGFTPEQFRRFHPGGALGRRLLTVADLMAPLADLAWLRPEASIWDVLEAMPGRRGFAVVSRAAKGPGVRLADIGVISEGDIRRAARDRDGFAKLTAGAIMSGSPKAIARDGFAIDALRLMESHRIAFLLCTDAAGSLVGAVHIHDIVATDVMPGRTAPRLTPEG